ncbi:alpha-glucosidase [Apilactobacillus xinyiensis]|uniref:Alpha-glucosidase n=1 Tax=Apilactobacillus xinyiensis TaxID=2841032 RepID=A0ABT0I2D3_9LACO|nr:alpha-glucosidase [Apilactobacillus xinyiensis]MCK8624872.1 alpha-glucosidase [Apilactobacillus xinyiensis]
MTNTQWWKNDVFYQIYPRSFKDSNGDGIGDLQGIISKLNYIKSLNVDNIWLSPIYKSPMVDMGYDIADYKAIDPIFGTMQDFDELLAKAKKLGIGIIMDLVVNHTSDQHAWFKAALKDPNSKYRDYYIFKHTNNGKAPNNWRSIFGGSTWDPVPNEPGTFYFHTFAKQQPDLNWENPALRQEIYKMINWWLDKGISGFRIDAITHIKKDLDWANISPDADDGLGSVVRKGRNRPGVDKLLDDLYEHTFANYDAVTIGEAYGLKADDLKKFVGPKGYFSMVFDFNYMNIDVADVDEWFRGQPNWSIKDLKDIIFKGQKGIKAADGWYANVLENHDQPRVLSKLIKDTAAQSPKAAKALGLMYFFLPGAPFIYQGQELGMKNFKRQSIDEFNDISSINNYHLAIENGVNADKALQMVNNKSRDNARTPMQWDDSVYGGFSQHTPWLPMGNQRVDINVKAEDNDSNSVLNFYREMSNIHHQPAIKTLLTNGKFKPIQDVPQDVVAYQLSNDEHSITVLVNLSNSNQHFSKAFSGTIQIDNYQNKYSEPISITSLSPYQAILIYK